MTIDARAAAARPSPFRWLQLAFGIVCMVMIANLQYGWTLFVLPIDAKQHPAIPPFRWPSAQGRALGSFKRG